MNNPIRCTNRSGVTGVSWSGQKRRWKSYIAVDGKTKNLGPYTRLSDANTGEETSLKLLRAKGEVFLADGSEVREAC